ncbi:MATE family efflux transporter [Clostridium tetanomorphum]|uniref:Probable multidrug resistance protein NorM n=1 Tax=Clostridium tetanomorphum TaxID=1553 RepID=A0A923EA62_CLOTT|nr:MATE family efflux transporter [Clostridium tetanomorphum]MBC2399298.1 MATE family efflux transporter [Clostridium tetanomorphum]
MIINKKVINNVLSLALPAVGEMFLYMMIWVLDTMMVGQYGGQVAVSTVGLSSEIMYTFINIFIAAGISVGTVSLISRKLGAKENLLAEEYASVGFLSGFILAFLISSTAFIFAPKILSFCGAKGNVLSHAIIYMRITSIGSFFNMIMNVLNATLRGSKNTKIPLVASAVINVVNLFLDWILIFGKFGIPELGIRGAAIATAIAHISGFLFISVYILKYSKIKPRLNYIKSFSLSKFKELIKLSLPSSLQEAAFSIIRLVGTIMIMHLGQLAFAANQITTTIESISFMPGTGFAIAATTLVGHKIGEKNINEAKQYAYACTLIGTLLMLLCGFIFLIFPKFLISLFINNSETSVINLGSTCLMIASIEQPFMGISMILAGSLKGAGDTKTPFLVSFTSSWVIRFPLMIYFIYILKLPVTYVWWITTIQWVFDGSVMFILFKKRFKNFLSINI